MAWNGTWTTAADLKGRSERNLLNQLLGALVERASVSFLPPTGLPAPLEEEKRIRPSTPNPWFSAFQTAMTALLTNRYYNHQTNGGNYAGLTTRYSLPVWTEADMLTAIGASSRIPAPSSGKLVREWAWQQYKILNLLRWVRTDIAAGVDVYERRGNTVAEWNAASWVATGGITGPFSYYRSSASPRYYTLVTKYRVTFGGSLLASADVYTYPIKIVDWTWWTDTGWTENAWNLADTVAEGASPLTSAEIGNRTIAGGSDPSGYQVQSVLDHVLVVKFDGPNGFTYKDW